jgi:hypothetical protein
MVPAFGSGWVRVEDFVKQVAISRKLFVIIVGLRSIRTEIYQKPGNQQL